MQNIDKETVLFRFWSENWQKWMPVTLIEYSNGLTDLHCQTGDHHMSAIKLANDQLAISGLVALTDKFDVMPTGVYYRVKTTESA